jgi:hypothetical protein
MQTLSISLQVQFVQKKLQNPLEQVSRLPALPNCFYRSRRFEPVHRHCKRHYS